MWIGVIGVTPVPIGLLLVGREVAEVPMRVVVVLGGPLTVIDDLAVVPLVVVPVLDVIDAIAVFASGDQKRR